SPSGTAPSMTYPPPGASPHEREHRCHAITPVVQPSPDANSRNRFANASGMTKSGSKIVPFTPRAGIVSTNGLPNKSVPLIVRAGDAPPRSNPRDGNDRAHHAPGLRAAAFACGGSSQIAYARTPP